MPGATIYRDVMYGRSRTSLCFTALGHPVQRRGRQEKVRPRLAWAMPGAAAGSED